MPLIGSLRSATGAADDNGRGLNISGAGLDDDGVELVAFAVGSGTAIFQE